MFKNEILKTVKLAHYFDSAFTVEQVFKYLPVKISKEEFGFILNQMIESTELELKDGFVFANLSIENHHYRRTWSKQIFRENKKYVSFLTWLPWIKFLGLTGANAFESCQTKDDLDIFVVTQAKRLWLTYLIIVIFSKLLRKRSILCVNYLVDENNLTIQYQSYYNAIQLLQMTSVFNQKFRQKLMSANEWIYDYLPNAKTGYIPDSFYLLGTSNRNGKPAVNEFLNKIDLKIYQKYSDHLSKKYKSLIGSSIVLQRGIAKLHRIDHQDIYNDIRKTEKVEELV